MTRPKRKSLLQMTAAELARATVEFDREFVIDSFGSPDVPAKKRLASARRMPGRPRRGRGVRVISLTVERSLLERTDKLATKLKVSRARLVEIGLRQVLRATAG